VLCVREKDGKGEVLGVRLSVVATDLAKKTKKVARFMTMEKLGRIFFYYNQFRLQLHISRIAYFCTMKPLVSITSCTIEYLKIIATTSGWLSLVELLYSARI